MPQEAKGQRDRDSKASGERLMPLNLFPLFLRKDLPWHAVASLDAKRGTSHRVEPVGSLPTSLLLSTRVFRECNYFSSCSIILIKHLSRTADLDVVQHFHLFAIFKAQHIMNKSF